MAIIVHFDVTGMDSEKYAQILRRLEAAGAGAPSGRLQHTCYGPKDQLVVVDVYDSPHSFEAFGATLVPILKALGLEATPRIHEVHNIIRGA
jgi:hypothetical protein